MGKLKTHKASAKRFCFTGSGKVKRGHMSTRHNTGWKPTKRMRGLRKSALVSAARMHDLKRQLPYQ